MRGRRVLWAAAPVWVALTLTGCTDEPEPTSHPPSTTEAAPSTEAVHRPSAERVARPRSPVEAAQRLAWAERVIADPQAPARELVRAAQQQQLAYRELGGHPGWDAAVLAQVPPSVRPLVRDNVAARREFRAMHGVLSDTLPAWRIVAPAPAEDLLRYYRRAERTFGIGWEYLAAINLVETGMGRIRGTSVAGAQGPMQFLPSTWARWGRGDIDDPSDAIMAAARYLAHDGGARPGGIDDALFRYNNSTHYVRGVTDLARAMERSPRAYYGYYLWDVYYVTSQGDVRLPVGYHRVRPVPVSRWLAIHKER